MSRYRRLAGLLACATLLAGCAGHTRRPGASPGAAGPDRAAAVRGADDTSRAQSERYRQDRDDGPAAPPVDIAKLAEPVPRAEPLSRYGNKPTYSVLGRSYHVLPSARGYVERGLASWYGNKFHGYMTSSFEPYDMYAFTAAHKTLPLPSYARVTNLDNGKSVIVRINDRGPFHENRIIDLSYAAAVRIGIWPKGTGVVEVRALDPDHSAAQAAAPRRAIDASANGSPAATPAIAQDARIYLQIGAFGERANAERALASAKRAGIDAVGIESVAIAGRTVHRVRVGPLVDAAAADAMTARIERLGLGAPRVTIER